MKYYKTIENSDCIICFLCQHYCKIPLLSHHDFSLINF